MSARASASIESLTRASTIRCWLKHVPTLLLIGEHEVDRKSTRLNSSHQIISYAVFCLKKKKKKEKEEARLNEASARHHNRTQRRVDRAHTRTAHRQTKRCQYASTRRITVGHSRYAIVG